MSSPNVAGATVFVSYVLGALVITAYICFGIWNTHKNSSHNTSGNNAASGKVQVTVAAATISFAVLSYHMLSFLIIYYQAWALQQATYTPSRVAGLITKPWLLWTWLKDSSLFLSFAETICNDAARFWWTQNALLYSIGWSIYMAIKGELRTSHIQWVKQLLSHQCRRYSARTASPLCIFCSHTNIADLVHAESLRLGVGGFAEIFSAAQTSIGDSPGTESASDNIDWCCSHLSR